MAIGEYIAKIDSDDVWEAEKLEKQVLFMEEHTEYGVCFSKVNIIDEESEEANTKFSDIFELFNKVKKPVAGGMDKIFFEKWKLSLQCICGNQKSSVAMCRRSL